MGNKRYGLKEVANVIFFDIVTNKPAIFFDTLKVSTIENESESAEARGGQGNNRLMVWDFGRTASLTMQDALLSDVSLAMLAGTAIKTTGLKAVGRETLPFLVDGAGLKLSVAEIPVNVGSITVYKVENGIMTDEITGFTLTAKDVKFATAPVGQVAGNLAMVFYEYAVVGTDVSQVTFSGNAFPATYKVVGDTIVRDENGVNRKMQFIIPRAKLQSNFSLAMDVENVATFDFNLEVLTEAGTGKLYDIIRL